MFLICLATEKHTKNKSKNGKKMTPTITAAATTTIITIKPTLTTIITIKATITTILTMKRTTRFDDYRKVTWQMPNF